MEELKDKIQSTQEQLTKAEKTPPKATPSRPSRNKSLFIKVDPEVTEDPSETVLHEGDEIIIEVSEIPMKQEKIEEPEEEKAVETYIEEGPDSDLEEEKVLDQEVDQDQEETEEEGDDSETDTNWKPPETKVKVKIEDVDGTSSIPKIPQRRFKEYPYDDMLAKLGILRCHHCPETFEKYGMLTRHCRHLHSCLPKVLCCNRHFQKPHLADHMKYHLDNSAFRCQLCSKDYLSGHLLTMHQQTKHQLGESKHQCQICQHKFRSPNFLAIHMIKHQDASEKPRYQCDQCDKSFTYESSLKGHVQRIHASNLTEMCDVCGLGFATKWILNAHKRNHTREAKSEQCDLCLRYFQKLASHKKRVHGNELVECKDCGKMISASYMRTHFKEYHTARSEIPCEICGKIFWNKKNYRVHMGLHQGIKYPCRFCPMDFGIMGNRTKHEKGRHLELFLQLKRAEAMEKQLPPKEG